MRMHCAEQVEGRVDVDVERRKPLLLGLVQHGARRRPAGGVHHDIDPAELGDGGLGDPLRGLGEGRIAGDEDAAASGLRKPRELVDLRPAAAPVDDDIRAARQQGPGSGEADARGAARHDGGGSFEVSHVQSP